MVKISTSYINTLEKGGFRNRTASLTINDFDMNMQSALTLESYDAFELTLPSEVSSTTSYTPLNLAIAERGRVTMGGGHLFRPPVVQHHLEGEFISRTLSSPYPVDGVYPIDPGGITFTISGDVEWASAKKPITIICEDVVKSIQVIVTDSAVISDKVYEVQGGRVVIDDLPNSRYSEIKLRAVALSRPFNRARIGRVLIGSTELFENEHVSSFEYEDINDCLNETLPYKKLNISIVNEGRLSQLDNLNNPRYKRLHTQAVLAVFQPTDDKAEEILMGKWYLDDYTITKETIAFSFFDGLSLLNEGEYPWHGHYYTGDIPWGYRVEELFSKRELPQGHPGIDHPFVINAFPSRFGLSYDLESSNPATAGLMFANPLPYESYAYGLQCIANATGNILRPLRTSQKELDTLGIVWLDLGAKPVRHLSRAAHMNVSLEIDKTTNAILVEYVTDSGKTKAETIATNFYVNDYLYTVATKSVIKSVSVEPKEISFQTTIYPHAIIISSDDADGVTTISIEAAEQVTQSQEFQMTQEEGATHITSNPLLLSNDRELREHAGRIFSVVENNVFYIWESRGYPELETGDMVSFETEEGIYRGLVVENKITSSGTSARGVTKLRRILDTGGRI